MTKTPLLIACHDCDTLHEIKEISHGQNAICNNCEKVIYQEKRNTIEETLALVIAGLIFFIPANLYPILSFEILGRIQTSTLFSAVVKLYEEGSIFVAIIVFATSILIPLIKLLGMLFVLLPLHFNKAPYYLPLLFRSIKFLNTWGMIEVYMLGILISMVKLADIAIIVAGIGLWTFAALLLVVVLVSLSTNESEIWQKMESINAKR